jgi:acetyl esterase/lipase
MSNIGSLAAAAGVALSLHPSGHPGLPKERVYQPKHKTPVGTVIDIHGGRWKASNNGLIDTDALFSIAMAKWGWKVVVPAFRGGRTSLADTRAVLNGELRKAHGKPVCVAGESSGGSLALFLAAGNSRVACVISQAAPVDFNIAHPSPGDDYATVTDAKRIWGARNGPVRYASRTQAAVLLLNGAGDKTAPPSRANGYVARAPHAANVTMRAGSTKWLHTRVNKASLTCAGNRAHALLNATLHGRAAAYRALGARRQTC